MVNPLPFPGVDGDDGGGGGGLLTVMGDGTRWEWCHCEVQVVVGGPAGGGATK